jgi:hypothetical protein
VFARALRGRIGSAGATTEIIGLTARGSMNYLFYIASAAVLFSQLGDVYAAGPYDGEWTGSATSTLGRCKAANLSLTVEDRYVSGHARFEVDAQQINGTVWEDGSFGATIGWQPFTGKFSANGFEGTFKSGDCTWKVILQRVK